MMKRTSFLPILILVILIAVFFFDALFLNHTFISSGMVLTDLYLFNYPLKSLLHQSLLTGLGVPLWTDLIGNGYPIFAEGQMGALYPFHLLVFSLPVTTITAFNLNLILHLILSGMFTYLYISKYIKIDKYASVLGAAVFVLSGYMLTHLHQVNIILVIAYFPLNLLLVEGIFAQNNQKLRNYLLSIILVCLVIYAQLNAGHIEMVYYNVLFTIIYAVLRLFMDPSIRSKVIHKAGIALAGLIFAIVLSLPQLASTYELVEFSQREQGLSYEHTTGTLWPLETLVLFINPKAYNVYRDEPGYNPSKIETVNIGALYPYIGIFPLVLAILSIATLFMRSRKINKQYKQWILLYTALLLLTYFYAVGRSTQLFTVIWEVVPGLKYFRFPIKAIYIIEFSLAILSAIGAAILIDIVNSIGRISNNKTNTENTQNSGFMKKNNDTLTRDQLVVSDNYAVNNTGSFKKSRIALIAVVVIIAGSFGDLYLNNRPIQPTILADDWLKTPEFAQFIQEAVKADQQGNAVGYTNWRSYSHGTNNIDYTRIFDFKLQKDLQNILHVDFNMIHNVPINREWAVLFLQRQTEINKFNTQISIEEGFLTLPADLKKSLDLQSVRFLLSDLPIHNDDLKLVKSKALSSTVDHVVFLANSVDATKIPTDMLYLYENPTYIPRLRMISAVNTQSMVPEDKKATNILSAVLSSEFDPNTQLVIEKDIPLEEKVQSPEQQQGAYTVVDYNPQKFTIITDSLVDSYLAINDTFYPGWQATVDNKEVEILRANYAFRAVRVPAGQHTITLQFQPTYLHQSSIAASLAAIGLSLLIVIYLFLHFRNKIKPHSL